MPSFSINITKNTSKKYLTYKNIEKKIAFVCMIQKKAVPLQPISKLWYLARAVRDRSAKPGTAVRIRQVPPEKSRSIEWLFLV